MTYKQRLQAYAKELYADDCRAKSVEPNWDALAPSEQGRWKSRAGRWMSRPANNPLAHKKWSNCFNELYMAAHPWKS